VTFIWVVIAGGCGAIARFLLDRGVERLLRKSTVAGVVLVNLLGSFVLGAIIGTSVHVSGATPLPVLSPPTYAALTTGLCGGFTTFSTAMADSLRLWRNEREGLALFHLFGTFAGAVVSCQLGFALFG
jgi:CrcB protein